MILSQLLPDNLPIVNSTIFENLGFLYQNLTGDPNFSLKKRKKSFASTFYQLTYVTKGKAILEHGRQTILLDHAFIYFSAPGRAQKLTISGDIEGHSLFISKEILIDILNKLPDARESYRDDAFILDLTTKIDAKDEIKILDNAFNNIEEELKKSEQLGLRALLLCWIRLAYISSFRLAHGKSAIFMTHHRNGIKFRKYLMLIDDQYRFHWTLAQYAKKLNITVSTLNNICRELGGESAKAYVSQRLLKEAEFLLRYTDHTIIEIAHQLGFKDSSYFSRFFRRFANSNPREYRKALLAE